MAEMKLQTILAALALVFLLDPPLSNALAGSKSPPVYDYQIVRVYPHDRTAFTQGLIYLDGHLYESTGLNGRSSLRKVHLETGRVLQEYSLPAAYFGEGLTHWGTDLLQITWKTYTGFVYDGKTFKVKGSFSYGCEGWGFTHDGNRLIMSDGTETLRFFDPQSFAETGQLVVQDRGKPVTGLNELEYVRGEIFANVWPTDRIVRISPQSGEVVGWVDLHGLLTPGEAASSEVLNGIAYDQEKERLFVTGKWWPKLFEIKLIRR